MKNAKLLGKIISDELGRILLLVILLFVPGSILFDVIVFHGTPDAAPIAFSIGFLFLDALLVREFAAHCRSAWLVAQDAA